jgi:hypothetical protein
MPPHSRLAASKLPLRQLSPYKSDRVKRSYSDSEAYTLRDASLRATQGASERALLAAAYSVGEAEASRRSLLIHFNNQPRQLESSL